MFSYTLSFWSNPPKIGRIQGLSVPYRFQVEWNTELPVGLCRACVDSALSAWRFRQTCLASDSTWRDILLKLTRSEDPPDRNKMYIYLTEPVSEVAEEESGECNDNMRSKELRRLQLECFDCGKEFAATNYLDRHLRGTTRRACYHCAMVLPRDRLGAHLAAAHGVLVHECDRCHELFAGAPQLRRHTAERHALAACQCAVCGHGFRNERSLRAHEYSHTSFDCTSCDKSFDNRKCFLFHRLACKQEAPTSFECTDCGVSYARKPSLKMHRILKHSGVPPYVCQVCGKRSATLAHAKAHEAIHGERPVYTCHCGAAARTLLGFQMHQRIHSGEKPYECEECGERFLSASRRSDHVKRRHWTSREMTHKCTDCSASYLRPFQLRNHYRKCHSK